MASILRQIIAALPFIAIVLGIALSAPARAQTSDMQSAAEYFRADAARMQQAALHPAHRDRRRQPARARTHIQIRQYVAASDHPLIAHAQKYLGGRNPTGTKGPWCRDFINHVLKRAGYDVPDKSRRARDAVRLGARVSNPKAGDIVVMRSHVTILVSRTGGVVAGLGGNQCGGRVCVSRYRESRIIAYVRPAGA
jgi:uncharacterized protein (TIGR02594 family)